MTKWILVLAMCACQSAPHSTTTPSSQVAELTARRTQMLDWLRDYNERGVYPTDELGRPTSVFRDADGVRCPMAELIYRSGRADLVDAVVAENNKLRLADVTEGPLYDWMASSGLTIEEIAMVQGAMEIDYSQFERTNQIILARGQVRGRIEMAVSALGNGTEHSVQVAATRLAKRPAPKARVIRTATATSAR
ncbi:MAG TPA: hypothetical protein VIV11_42880 [Kofleriaceae bacterium]